MTKLRSVMVVGHSLMFVAISLWVYSGYRYDALNIGGAAGDVNFWIRMGDIGFYGGIPLWILCIVVAIWGTIGGKLGEKSERVFWCLFSVCGAPALAFGLNAILNAGIRTLA